LIAPWPFFRWGIDILGPFPISVRQFKFIVVVVEYFTKWIEVEALTTITAEKITKFVWRSIICRFGVPKELISDNGTQFISRKMKLMCEELGIRHIFSSVEHPQTNGQAKAANKVILQGLEKKLGAAKAKWVDVLP